MAKNVSIRDEGFVQRANMELKRAERYHVFLSLICIDLSFVDNLLEQQDTEVLSRLVDKVQAKVRVCDLVSALSGGCLAMLSPETNRDGAEVVARRVAAAVRDELTRMTGKSIPEIIPLEIASFPDAAGARTVSQLLEMAVNKSQN